MENEELKGREYLRSLLNKTLRIKLTDGRSVLGQFLCVDRDANIIIGSATEYPSDQVVGVSRVLGLAMVPGRHATSILVYNPPASPLELFDVTT